MKNNNNKKMSKNEQKPPEVLVPSLGVFDYFMVINDYL